jgi:hypothetical protein
MSVQTNNICLNCQRLNSFLARAMNTKMLVYYHLYDFLMCCDLGSVFGMKCCKKMCLLPLPRLSICPHTMQYDKWKTCMRQTFMRFNVGGLILKSNFYSNWTKIMLSFMGRQAHFSMHLVYFLVNICHNEKYIEQKI